MICLFLTFFRKNDLLAKALRDQAAAAASAEQPLFGASGESGPEDPFSWWINFYVYVIHPVVMPVLVPVS